MNHVCNHGYVSKCEQCFHRNIIHIIQTMAHCDETFYRHHFTSKISKFPIVFVLSLNKLELECRVEIRNVILNICLPQNITTKVLSSYLVLKQITKEKKNCVHTFLLYEKYYSHPSVFCTSRYILLFSLTFWASAMTELFLMM